MLAHTVSEKSFEVGAAEIDNTPHSCVIKGTERWISQGGCSAQRPSSQQSLGTSVGLGERKAFWGLLQQDLSLVNKGTRENRSPTSTRLYQTPLQEHLNWVSLFLSALVSVQREGSCGDGSSLALDCRAGSEQALDV